MDPLELALRPLQEGFLRHACDLDGDGDPGKRELGEGLGDAEVSLRRQTLQAETKVMDAIEHEAGRSASLNFRVPKVVEDRAGGIESLGGVVVVLASSRRGQRFRPAMDQICVRHLRGPGIHPAQGLANGLPPVRQRGVGRSE
jgi:hypothetical protein